jgi:hypothetical protein
MNKVLLRPLFRNAYLKKSEKKLDVKKFNVGGFSKVEKRNLLLTPITSALLQARKMPGEGELGALARAFGKGIQGLPQTQLAIREIEQREKAAQTAKFASSKKVLDQDTGNIIFKPEEEIQTVLSETKPGQPRFVPTADDKTRQPKSVWDTVEQTEVFVDPNQILTTKLEDGSPRYVPVGKSDSLVKAYEVIGGVQSDTPKFVTKKQVIENPDSYIPVEGNIEMMLKMGDVQRKKKQKSDADASMISARNVTQIIRRLEKDMVEKGAFTGSAGDTVLAITGISGFIDSFVNRQREADPRGYAEERRQTEEAIRKLTDPENPNYNARITRYLNAPETQAAKTSIIDLAYSIAKVREPGGRFSVPDIELALKSIGESSNKANFLSGLKRLGGMITDNTLYEYQMAYDLTRDQIPNKHKEVVDANKYFSGVPLEGDTDSPDDLDF